MGQVHEAGVGLGQLGQDGLGARSQQRGKLRGRTLGLLDQVWIGDHVVGGLADGQLHAIAVGDGPARRHERLHAGLLSRGGLPQRRRPKRPQVGRPQQGDDQKRDEG